jgi:hypothetical protein
MCTMKTDVKLTSTRNVTPTKQMQLEEVPANELQKMQQQRNVIIRCVIIRC